MKFVAVGNQFICWEMMEKEIKKHFPTATVVGYDTGWPSDLSKSVYKGAEVSEYDGTEEDIVAISKGADYLVIDIAPITKKVLDTMPKLKGIAVTRGGAVNINVEEATKRGIPVFNSPGRNLTAVAEFNVALALAHLKNIPIANSELKKGKWRSDFYSFQNIGKEVTEIKVGLIGFGNIGRQVAKMFSALGSEVVVFDPFVPENDIISLGYQIGSINDICKICDVISLHARVTQENMKMIGREQFSLMKADAILINTARGELVDMDALYTALKDKTIGGAALDVFDKEPLSKDSNLYELDNLTMTPHIGGASLATVKRAVGMAITDLAHYSKGEEPLYCLNPEVLNK